jgi:hypothetical protein
VTASAAARRARGRKRGGGGERVLRGAPTAAAARGPTAASRRVRAGGRAGGHAANRLRQKPDLGERLSPVAAAAAESADDESASFSRRRPDALKRNDCTYVGLRHDRCAARRQGALGCRFLSDGTKGIEASVLLYVDLVVPLSSKGSWQLKLGMRQRLFGRSDVNSVRAMRRSNHVTRNS